MPKLILLDDDDRELLKSLLEMHWEIGDEDHNARAGRLRNEIFPELPSLIEAVLAPKVGALDVAAIMRAAESALEQGHENVTGSFDHTVGAADSMWADPLRDVRKLMDEGGIHRE